MVGFTMYDKLEVSVPETDVSLKQGNKVKLHRFETDIWEVCYGWYSWGGNRPVIGWYLKDVKNFKNIKPLQLTDLYDIYLVEI